MKLRILIVLSQLISIASDRRAFLSPEDEPLPEIAPITYTVQCIATILEYAVKVSYLLESIRPIEH